MGKQPSLEVGVTHYHIPPNHRRAGIGVRLTNVKQSLVRWQRGEPVTAHPPTLRYVAGRYVRRHIVPLAISAVAVLGLLVTAIVALLIHSILIGREKARVEEQRVLAQRNFERARDAVDQLLTEVGEVELADVPQMEPVRKRLLAKAQRFYLDFLEEKRTDPNLLREAGRAYCRLGEIQEILGEYPSAERAFRQAIELLEEQSAQRPAGVDTRPDLRAALPTWVVCSRRPIGSGKLRSSAARPSACASSWPPSIPMIPTTAKPWPIAAITWGLCWRDYLGEVGRMSRHIVMHCASRKNWRRRHTISPRTAASEPAT